MPTRAEIAKRILDGHDPNEIVAVSVWDEDDIRYMADEIDEELTKEEIDQALNYLHSSHSASVGITWDSIEYAIRHVCRMRGNLKQGVEE
jgi:hypothetical protein